MAGLREEVLHDATCLYDFVNSVTSLCDDLDGSPAYLRSSKDFFKFIHNLGEKTKLHLLGFANHLPAAPADFSEYRRELLTLREGWSKLHELVKPATDADTLHLPAPLLEGLLRRFRELRGYSKIRFTVFHSQELNYLQVKASQIRNIADSVAKIVGARGFPVNLGMIGIPYSQSSSLFRNCLIPHEMGHFVFQDKKLQGMFLNKIEQRLIQQAGIRFQQESPDKRSWYIDRVASWAEELFCDLFAVALVGPCYSFAYIELFDLTTALDGNGNLDPVEAFNSGAFSPTHPADFFRLHEQCAMLVNLGWWGEIRKFKSHYVKLLNRISVLPHTQFHAPLGTPLDLDLIAVFDSFVAEIVGELTTIVDGLDSHLTEFRELEHLVEECLSNGVVPSTIWVWRRNWIGRRVPETAPRHPTPVVVLNAAYKFHLEKLDGLLSRIKGQSTSSVKDRYYWVKKLEAWTLKAIEDQHLLSGQRN